MTTNELQLPSGITSERKEPGVFETQALSNNIRSRREPLFQSLPSFFSSSVVILKGDSNASIRVWENLMKPGELPDVSYMGFSSDDRVARLLGLV
jgi:hypothetical protein